MNQILADFFKSGLTFPVNSRLLSLVNLYDLRLAKNKMVNPDFVMHWAADIHWACKHAKSLHASGRCQYGTLGRSDAKVAKICWEEWHHCRTIGESIVRTDRKRQTLVRGI